MMRRTLFVSVLVTWGLSSEATFHKRFHSPGYPVQQPGLQYNLPPMMRYIRLNDQLYAVLGEKMLYLPAAGSPVIVNSAPDPGAASFSTLEPISNDPPVPQTPGVGVVLTNSASDANGAATHAADAGNFLPTTDPLSSQSATDELVPSAPYSAPEPAVQTVQPQVALPNSPIPTATPVTAEPVNTYEAPSGPTPTLTDQSNVRGGHFTAQSGPHATNAGLDFHSAPSGPLVPPSQAGIAASAPLGPVVYAASGSGAPPSVDRPVVLTVSNPKVTVTTKIMKYNLRHPPKLYTEPVTVVFSNRDEKSLPTEAAKGVPFTISSVSDPSLLQQAPILVKGQDEFDQSQRLKGYSSVTSQSNFGPAAPSGNYITHPDSSTPSVYNTPQIYQTKNTDQQSHHLISYTLAQPPLLKLQIDPATRKTFYVDASDHQIELESPGSGISPSSPYSPSSQPQGTGLQFYGAAKGLDQVATSSSNTIKENVKMNDMVGLNSFYGSNNPAFLTTPRSGNGEMQDLLSTPVAYNAEGHNVRSVQSQQPRDAATLSRLPDLLRLTYQRLDKSGQADRPLMTLPGYGST